MRKTRIVLLVLVGVTLVGGAGYLGTRSAQGQATPAGASPAGEVPETVEVTRGDVQLTVTAPGHLVGTRLAELSFEVAGTLSEVCVRPGDPVQAGDLLASIDPGPMEAAVAAAQAELDAAQARRAQLSAGPSAAELAAAQLALAQAEAELGRLRAGPSAAAVAAAEAEVAAARRDLAALKSLPDAARVAQARAELDRAEVVLGQAQAAYDLVKGRPDVGMTPQARALQEATIGREVALAALEAANRPATATELDAARARLAAAQATLAQEGQGPTDDELRLAEMQVALAQANLDQLADGPPAAELRLAEAAVRAAELALEQAQSDLEATRLVAPFDGAVTEVRAAEGEKVGAGMGLIVLTDPATVEVQASVIEEDVPLVKPGQAVELFFDARPEAEVRGTVSRLVPQRLPGDRPLYPVTISPSEVPEGLLAGMTVDASIVIESRQGALCLPRSLVRARADGSATVQVWSDGQIETREVRTGLRGDVYVEILDGLAEGEQVVAQ